MGKIIHLKDHKESLVGFLENILKLAQDGKIEKIMIASFSTDKNEKEYLPEVLTGYFDLKNLEKQYLLSVLQTDIAYFTVEANIDKLVEKIE